MTVVSESLEKHRAFWAKIARENGWYASPFYIVAWVDDSGEIRDSVSYTGLDHDVIAEYWD